MASFNAPSFPGTGANAAKLAQLEEIRKRQAGGLTVPMPAGIDPNQPMSIESGQPLGIGGQAAQQVLGGAAQPTPEQVNAMAGAGQVSPNVASQFAARNVVPTQTAQRPVAGITGNAGAQLAGTQRRFGKEMAGIQGEMAVADENLKTAIMEQGAAQAKAAEETATALNERNQALSSIEERQAKISEERNKATAEITDKIQRLTQEVNDYRINPDRMFSGEKGTWNKVGAGIAIALGAIGSGLKGGPNQGLQAINAAIDNDIRNQQADLGNKQRVLKGQQSLLELNKEKFGSMEAAIEATKLQQLDATKRRIEEIQAGSQSQVQKSQAAETIAKIDQEINVRKANIAQQMQTSAEKTIMQRAQLRQADAVAYAKSVGKAAPHIAGLEGGESATKEDRKQSQKVIANFNDTNRAIDELIALRKEKGAEYLDRDSIGRMKQLATQLQLQLKDQYGLGVLSGPDQELLENIITSDPSEIGFVLNRLQTLKKDILASTQSKLKAYGGFSIPETTLTDIQAQ